MRMGPTTRGLRAALLVSFGLAGGIACYHADTASAAADRIEAPPSAHGPGKPYNEIILKSAPESNQRIDMGGGDDFAYGRGGSDEIRGSEGNDELFGDEGDDIVSGGEGSDRIHGGTGDDMLFGGNSYGYDSGDGPDLFFYELGDGNDRLTETDSADNIIDAIVFGPGILPANVRFHPDTSQPDDTILSFRKSSGSITMVGFSIDRPSAIEEIQFADGTVWDKRRISVEAGYEWSRAVKALIVVAAIGSASAVCIVVWKWRGRAARTPGMEA